MRGFGFSLVLHSSIFPETGIHTPLSPRWKATKMAVKIRCRALTMPIRTHCTLLFIGLREIVPDHSNRRKQQMITFPQRLIQGYHDFAGGRLRREQDRYRELAERGQSPQVMVIGCSDSRVSPEVIFDASPGELFVVRNVANVVPPYTPDGRAHGVSAALEFGISVLRVKHIVVLGHAQCGGVKAYAEETDPRA